jgi:mRNA interferase YafQ
VICPGGVGFETRSASGGRGAVLVANSTRALTAEFKDHPLRGNFAGSRDCHIEPTWVLIYTLTEKDTHVRFERTGTHICVWLAMFKVDFPFCLCVKLI